MITHFWGAIYVRLGMVGIYTSPLKASNGLSKNCSILHMVLYQNTMKNFDIFNNTVHVHCNNYHQDPGHSPSSLSV